MMYVPFVGKCGKFLHFIFNCVATILGYSFPFQSVPLYINYLMLKTLHIFILIFCSANTLIRKFLSPIFIDSVLQYT